MSTSYYRLAEPISAVYVRGEEPRCVLDVWVDDELAGGLSLSEAALTSVLRLLCEDGSSICSSNGFVSGLDRNWPDTMQLVNEYGRLVTVGELRLIRKNYLAKRPQ